MADEMHPMPVLMRRAEIISMAEAVRRTGKTDKTLRKLCRKHGICRQTGEHAPLEISAPGLEMVMGNLPEALELLRDGNRSDPKVARVFRHLGLSTEVEP